MTTFDRRSFLGSVFATAGFAAAPDWLARAMAPQDPAAPDRVPRLREAVQRAQANGKPLLVFVVPEDRQNEGPSRSQWFGAWLNHGGPTALHAIALCEVAAANRVEIEQATGAKVAEALPHIVLLDVMRVGEPEALAPKATEVRCAVEPIWTLQQRAAGEGNAEGVKKKVLAGLETITAAVQDGLNRHGATVAAVAAASLSKFDDTQRAQLAQWLATGRGAADELVVRGAAEVRRAAADLPEARRARVLDGLTAAVTKVVVKQRVPGSRWQLPGGCGSTSYEDPTEAEKKQGAMMACGMGIVTPLCERFLDFWAPGI